MSVSPEDIKKAQAPAPQAHSQLSQFLGDPMSLLHGIVQADTKGIKADKAAQDAINKIINPQAASTTPNPLAMSLFATQTIAPLMQQLVGMNNAASGRLMGNMGPLLKGAPSNLTGDLASQAMANQNLNFAAQQSALAQPELQQLMTALNAEQAQQLKTYQEDQLLRLAGTSGTGGVSSDVAALAQAAGGGQPTDATGLDLPGVGKGYLNALIASSPPSILPALAGYFLNR